MFRRGKNFARMVLISGLMLGGCDAKDKAAAPLAPSAVTVAKPTVGKVADFVEFTGTTEAFASVDIRARVKGFLKKIHFTDGAFVKEGDLLFEIEPDLFIAEVDRGKAALAAGQAHLEKAKADLAIKQEMAAGNAASKLDVIQAEADVATATAEVTAADALLQQANINLGYTKIYAPIAGKIDRSRVDVGNLVGSDGNTLLASIVQSNPIYVYFDIDEPTLQKFMDRLRKESGGKPVNINKNELPMTMALGNSPDFEFKGFLDYVDNKVDTASGTIRIRGVIPNPDYTLVPGFFARVRVPDGNPYDATLVPERAIGVDQGRKYVLVVNDKNVVENRVVETGSAHGRMRVVTKGVSPGEWVITEGILRTRPGATVAPQPESAPSTQPRASAAAKS